MEAHIPPWSLGLSLLTVNVNGLRGFKVARLLQYLQLAGSPDVVLLQEVKMATVEQLHAALQAGAGPGLPWRGRTFYNAGSNNSRGVAILVKEGSLLGGLPDSSSGTWSDQDGRVLRLDCSLLHHQLSIMCVYAPTRQEERAAFWSALDSHVPLGRIVVMGGDFNCTLDPRSDERVPSPFRAVGRQELQQLIAGHGLVDVWATRQPHLRGYTYPRLHNTSAGSRAVRLDRFLLSTAAVAWTHSLAVVDGAPADHHGVSIRLQPPSLPCTGPGGRVFPTYLLHHPALSEQLSNQLDVEAHRLQADLALTPADRWEGFKRAAWDAGQHLHKQYVARREAEMRSEQRQAARSRWLLEAAPRGSRIAAVRAAAADEGQRRLAESAAYVTGRAARAAGALWQRQAERPTAHFYAQVSPHRDTGNRLLTCLRVPGQHQPVSLSEGPRHAQQAISTAATAFYCASAPSGLFRPGQPSISAQDTLLGSMRVSLPDVLRQHAEGPQQDGHFTAACLHAALCATKNGKAPGSDGLPYEVYKALWPVAKDLLVAAANAALDAAMDSSLPPGQPASWREGIISLFYKGKGPRDQLASYRPISLLNADYKVVTKAIAARLQAPLAFAISPMQTAFLQGRQISSNVLYHLCSAISLSQQQQPAALLILDLEKAYDRVDRPFTLRVAEALGFGPGMMAMLRMAMAPARAAVTVNGLLSDWIQVHGGLWQGDSLSPVLWAMYLQPLTAYLQSQRDSGVLRTPKLADGDPAPAAAHHADDTKLLVQDADIDGPVAMAAVNLFCQAANAKVNVGKCKGVALGSHRAVVGMHAATGVDFGGQQQQHDQQQQQQQHGDQQHDTQQQQQQQQQHAPAAPPPPLLLGVPFTLDMAAAATMAYSKRKGQIAGYTAAWRPFELSLLGRVEVIRQQMAASLVYHMGFVPVPEQLMVDFEAALTRFAATSPLPEDATIMAGRPLQQQLRPRLPVAKLPRDAGGVGFVDLPSHADALQAKWIAHSFAPGTEPWQRQLRALVAAACPVGSGTAAWILTKTLPHPSAPPFIRVLIDAFRATGPQRMPPKDGDIRGRLCEPLFGNPLIVGSNGQPLPWPADWPAGWPATVGQLRTAPASTRAHPLLQAVAAALPQSWLQLLEEPLPQLVPGEWVWASVIAGEPWEGWACQVGPGGGCGPEGFGVLPSGRLVSAAFPARLPASAWRPACVIAVPKPRHAWTPEECDAYAAAPLGERDAARPTEPALLGPWDALSVYTPSVGHGTLPLHAYTVRNARLPLTLRRCVAALGRAAPLRPAAWPDPGTGGSALADMEAQWAADRPLQLHERLALAPAAELPRCQQLGRDRQPRPPPRDRTSGVGDAATAAATAPATAEGAADPAFTRPPALVMGDAAAPAAPAASGPVAGNAAVVAAAFRMAAAQRSATAARQAADAAAANAVTAAEAAAAAGPSRIAAARIEVAARAAEAADTAGARAAAAEEAAEQAAAGHAEAAAAAPAAGNDAAAQAPSPAATPNPTPAGAGVPVDATEARKAWRRLHKAPVCNRLKTLAWRLMHGNLPCGLYLSSKRPLGANVHLCPNQTCRDRRQRRPLDSISHIFVECPTYLAARTWLADVWFAVAGSRPPLTAAVLLGDAAPQWDQYPKGALQQLWTALRLAWLHSLWVVHHSSGTPLSHSSHAVIAATVGAMRQRIREAFCYCSPGPRIFDALPLRVIRTDLPQTSCDAFNRLWGHRGVLAHAVLGAASGQPELQLHLSMTAPVAAPPPPLPAEEDLEA